MHTRLAIAGAALGLALHAQAPDQTLQFEVASVKPSAPRPQGAPQGRVGCFGGPGSRDPVRYQCTNASVSILAVTAYDLKGYQLRPPASTDSNRFDITAGVPPGTTKEQVRVMLQNLLAERFRLVFHREKTEKPGYALVVSKNGLQMKESAPEASADGASRPGPKPIKDADGFVYTSFPGAIAPSMAGGLTRWVGNRTAVQILVSYLNSLLDRPVIDSTGLAGNYDFVLTFSNFTQADDGSGGLPIFGALEKQLGLRLEPRKLTIDEFVIDHAEKTPGAN
jgi:uncharacterized protein (TIGR03435 family)